MRRWREESFQRALQAIYVLIEGSDGISAQQAFAYYTSSIEYLSSYLCIELPEMFVPYYFKYNFNVLEKIAQSFNIKLPSLPLKSDYQGRFFYYREVCAAFWEFRTEYNLSPYEFVLFSMTSFPKV